MNSPFFVVKAVFQTSQLDSQAIQLTTLLQVGYYLILHTHTQLQQILEKYFTPRTVSDSVDLGTLYYKPEKRTTNNR